MRDHIPVVWTTFRLVFSVLPPLIQIGVIDRLDCIILGAVIGLVVAVRSNRSGLG